MPGKRHCNDNTSIRSCGLCGIEPYRHRIESIFEGERWPLAMRTTFVGTLRCEATSSTTRRFAALFCAFCRTDILNDVGDVASNSSFLAPACTRTLTYIQVTITRCR